MLESNHYKPKELHLQGFTDFAQRNISWWRSWKQQYLGAETQYEIEYGPLEMCKNFKVQKKVQFQETASWKTAYWTLNEDIIINLTT